ncbi:MAG: protein kinase [Kofleriaceae bacterium]
MSVEIGDQAFAKTATLAQQPRPVSHDLLSGSQLGHFKIENKLGAGGMGEVYLATDLALDRPVAIKVLPEGSATSGNARERLIREARAQARIQHPNVGHIYFIGEDAGRLYFAMEYLAGKTLAERVTTGPLTIPEALGAIRSAALGLREAQREGFTHRDVKPSNLMTDAHGTVKVLDFGIVSAAPEPVSGDAPVEQTTMAGTPLYMAPEQARGAAIDHRADIYALGATLYHLVSGKPPFAAETLDGLITKHETAVRPPVPRKGHARVAATAVDNLISRMMAPDPAKRFTSYDELIRAIDTVSARPAGAIVRGIAQLIDVILMSILVGGITIPFGGGDVNGEIIFPLVFVYSTLLIAWLGTTAGKGLLDLEVISVATGGKPTLVQAFVRSGVMLGPPVVLSFVERLVGGHLVMRIAVAVAFILPFALLVFAAMGSPGKRAWWDRISGTQVRYRRAALLP